MTEPIIEYYDNGNKKIEQYVVNGKLHRDPLEGPAHISYFSNAGKYVEVYLINNKLHNLYGPACIEYHKNGKEKIEKYFLNGELHRDPLEGPACICYDENRKIFIKEYRVNGKFHNPYAPAFNSYTNKIFDWFLNGKEYTSEVYKYLNRHSLHYKNMTQIDFDIMWMNIL